MKILGLVDLGGGAEEGRKRKNKGRGYFAGLRVTKRNKATVLLTLTIFQTPTLTPIALILTLTLI
jgi:hypothetical protein